MKINSSNWNCMIWKTLLVFTIFIFSLSFVNAYDSVAQIYDSSYAQNGNNAAITMNFSLESFVQDAFTHNTSTNNSRLYVDQTGMYKVSYSCVWNATGGGADASSRRIYENYLRINGATIVTPSESNVYIRGDNYGVQAGGHTSSTSATALVNLTSGDYIELRGGEDPRDTNNGNTVTWDSCFLLAQKLNTKAIEVFDGVGGQAISGIGDSVVVNLDSTYYNGDSSLYNLNNDQINVSQDGWYKVSYTSCIEETAGSRISPQSWIRKNGNTNISLSFSFAGYTRGSNNDRDRNCNRASTLINLTNGDYIELQTGIHNQEGGTQTLNTLINQSWLIIEKVELDSSIISINNSGQQIDHGVTAAVNFDINDKIGDHVTHTGSNSKIYFDKAGLYELAYNIGYQDYAGGERVITCGELRKNGDTLVKPSRQCIYTRADAQARTGTVSSTTIINVTKDDYVEILIDVTGEAGGSDSEDIQILKGTTWFTVVKINETPKTRWENPTLDLGDGNVSQGNLTGNINMLYFGEGQNNIDVTCVNGNCSVITDDWTDNTNINHNVISNSVGFNCDDSVVGRYNATFKVNSTEDPIGDNLTVYCDINQTYGYLIVTLNQPLVNSYTNVYQNETFLFNSTVTCNGPTSSICGNVTIYSRYNVSGGFTNISTTSTTPLWTTSTQPNNCILSKDESCDVTWLINATGNLGKEYKLNVNATSNFSQIFSNFSGNTTINITLLPPDSIVWTSVSLNLGSGGLNLGNVTGSTNILASGAHNNITTNCISGTCNKFSDNWTDLNNLSDGNSSSINFECDDSTVGNFWALFKVNSSQDSIGSNLNVSCEITQTYGTLNVTLIYPPELSNTIIPSQTIFDINASISCEGTQGASCGIINATPRYGELSNNYGDGSDGSLIISAPNTIVNNYTYLTGNENSGQNNITVNNSAAFNIGDEILIIQIQDGLGTGSAGNYEFKDIINKSGNYLILNNNLSNTYGSGTSDSTTSSVTQVIRIPQYTNVTIQSGNSITAPAWNGYSGGIVSFRATQFIKTIGYINVSEKGFRGGDCNGCGNNAWGDQGEGTSGIGTSSTGANDNGGGGGDGGGGDGAPGGGGGYGTVGIGGSDDSGSNSFGGNVKGNVNLSKIFFGGGAGAGGDNLGRTPSPENVDGGGIVIIFGKNIQEGRIISQGETGIFGSSGSDGGVSGSGAGGTIWITGTTINLTDVNASGGPSVSGSNGDSGGAGGDGRIRLDRLYLEGISDPTAGHITSSSFTEQMILFKNNTGDLPFFIVGSLYKGCASTIYEGETCNISWDTNVTTFDQITYRINVNASSSESLVPENASKLANITIDVIPIITIHTPLNNSRYASDITAKISSNIALIYASFYLNGNLSNITSMIATNSENKTWIQNLTLDPGFYNITFIYNESSYEQNSTSPHYFTIINQTSKSISKTVINNGSDLYLIDINVTNNNDYSNDFIVTEFVDSDFNAWSFDPLNDFTNSTNGSNYIGTIYGWNLTINPLTTNYLNYSITKTVTNRYYLRDAYIVGLD